MRSLLAICLLVLVAGCGAFESDAPDLGDPYSVAMSPEPLLDGDRLQVAVQYSGGCREHVFQLGSDRVDGEPVVWLTHDDGGDLCEALITDTLDVPVPSSALRGRPVRLYVSETETIALSETLR